MKILNSTKYGQVMVSNQDHKYELYDENNDSWTTYPAGLVIRWIPKGSDEPTMKVVENIFTSDFKDNNEILKYIENNNILG